MSKCPLMSDDRANAIDCMGSDCEFRRNGECPAPVPPPPLPRVRHKVKCPYCKLSAEYWILAHGLPEIIACDADAGGCDRYFTIRARRRITIDHTRKLVDATEYKGQEG